MTLFINIVLQHIHIPQVHIHCGGEVGEVGEELRGLLFDDIFGKIV